MTEPKVHSRKNVTNLLPLVIAVIGAFGGGFGSNYLLVRGVGPEALAPDRYTGIQGAAVEQSLAGLVTQVDELEQRVNDLPPRAISEGLALLKQDLEYLRADFSEHERAHRDANHREGAN